MKIYLVVLAIYTF